MPWLPEAKLFDINLEKIGKTFLTLGILGVIGLISTTFSPELAQVVSNHPVIIYGEVICIALGATSFPILKAAKNS